MFWWDVVKLISHSLAPIVFHAGAAESLAPPGGKSQSGPIYGSISNHFKIFLHWFTQPKSPEFVKCPNAMETVHLLYFPCLLTKGQAMIHCHTLTPPHSYNEYSSELSLTLTLTLSLSFSIESHTDTHTRTKLGSPSCLPLCRSHAPVAGIVFTPRVK